MSYRTPAAHALRLLCLALLLPQLAAASEPELAPCDDAELGAAAECGTFRVFENRAGAAGRTIDLQFVRLRATGETPETVPLVLLAGGPGQGGTGLADLALEPFEAVRERRDVLLVDLRGTGGSNPLECDTPEAAENPQAVFGDLFDPARFAACAERLRATADLTLYTTAPSVDDLDELRRALGYEKLLFWGGSGGTRTALVYMQRHPEAVAGAVLDSLAPPGFDAPLHYAAGSQRALDKIFEGCRAEPACRERYPRLAADFESLVARLRSGSVRTRFTVEEEAEESAREFEVDFHLGDFGYAVRGLLYRANALHRLPEMIDRAAATGDLGEFAAAYYLRQRGLEPAVAEGLHLSTICAEDVRRILDSDVPRATAGTFLGDYLIRQYRRACAVWDVGAPPAGFYDPVTLDVPVLVLSGDLDPSTPPRWGREVTRHLPGAVHLAIDDAAHGVSFHDCTRPIVMEFLKTLELPDHDPLCAQQGRLEMAPPAPAGDGS